MDSARLSRIQLDGNQMVGDEQVLIEDWCQQGPTHTIGDLHFGADGALYVSGGEAASPDFVDYGQAGIPLNPCDDPPVGVGEQQTAPTRAGRRASQPGPAHAVRPDDARRQHPAGGPRHRRGAPGQPAGRQRRTRTPAGSWPTASATPSASRSARGRTRSGRATWAGTPPRRSTAWSTRPTASVENFGWPCYEGLIRQGGYDSANLSVCETLYGSGSVTSPFFTYEHSAKVFPEETCPTGTSSISGMAFTPPGSPLPAEFDGALFFADYARKCIWVMERSGGSLPSPSRIRVFRAGASMPVDIQFGPGGDLFYADVWGGTIKRIHYTDGNQAPKAVASASATQREPRRSS